VTKYIQCHMAKIKVNSVSGSCYCLICYIFINYWQSLMYIFCCHTFCVFILIKCIPHSHSQNTWAAFISVFIFCFLKFSELPIPTMLSFFSYSFFHKWCILIYPYISYNDKPLIIVFQTIIKPDFTFCNLIYSATLEPWLCLINANLYDLSYIMYNDRWTWNK
jgi:hypothetical protein